MEEEELRDGGGGAKRQEEELRDGEGAKRRRRS